MFGLPDQDWCKKCRRVVTIVDQFAEADHGLNDATQWGVTEFSCGHYVTGPATPVITQQWAVG